MLLFLKKKKKTNKQTNKNDMTEGGSAQKDMYCTCQAFFFWDRIGIISLQPAWCISCICKYRGVPTNLKRRCEHLRYIYEWSQTSYTTPCNGVVSSGAQFGGLRVFADHMREKTQNKWVHDLRAPRGVLRVFVFMLRPQYMQVLYAPDEPTGKPRRPPLSPMPGSRWCRFWDLWCISVVSTDHIKM